MKLLLTILLLTACSTGKNKAHPNHEPMADIIEIKDMYLSLMPSVQDDFGFVYSDQCDSLLWTSLAVFSGAEADLYAARDERTGKWFRTPYKDCYRNEQENNDSSRKSKSENSGDMFTGLSWPATNHDSLAEIPNQVIDYGRKHNWIMGKGPISRTYLKPTLQRTIYAVAGKSFKGLPDVWLDPKKDHQRHIVALNILLRGEAEGEISDGALDLINGFAKDQECNGVFQFGRARYDTGDFTKAIEIFNRYCPKDRLPTTSDHCGRWLWERSCDHKNYQPCKGEKVHSGGDCIFLAKLLEMALKQ